MSASASSRPSLDRLLDEAPVGLVVTDTKGLILEINRTACTWAGRGADELVGRKKLQDLFTVGGRIFHQTHWMPILEMQRSISEVKFELCRSDGRRLTVLMNAVRKASADGPYDIVSINLAEERNKYERQLLLERKRSEELAEKEVRAREVLRAAESQLRHAVRVGALHLWSADESGTRCFDPSVVALLELDDGAPVREEDLLNAILAKDRDAEAQAFRDALASPALVHSWTFGIRDAKGNHKVLLASGQAFPRSGDTGQQFFGVLRDITDLARKRTEAEDRALFAEQMVGIVSHDLRNPLAAIMMGTTLLSRDPAVSHKYQKVLENIRNSSQRAKRLIDELLDFTLVRVGHGLAVARTSANFHDLVGRCVDELRLAFPGNEIRHVAHGPGDCFPDADRIAQLLGNLVANAVTYGDAGGAITVTSSGDYGECRLEVHNFGEPVPEAMLDRIFEPLVRGGTTDQSVRSVGLGLFIVKAIALAHQGTVTVTSSREQGTTFCFVFKRQHCSD